MNARAWFYGTSFVSSAMNIQPEAKAELSDGFPGCPVHSRTLNGCDYCAACLEAVLNQRKEVSRG